VNRFVLFYMFLMVLRLFRHDFQCNNILCNYQTSRQNKDKIQRVLMASSNLSDVIYNSLVYT